MKKITLILFLSVCIIVVSVDQNLRAETKVGPKSTSGNSSTYQELAARVFEIRSMDRSTLSLDEKQGLKSELKMIKKALRENAESRTERNSGGIYISVGALIIIIILLIVLL